MMRTFMTCSLSTFHFWIHLCSNFPRLGGWHPGAQPPNWGLALCRGHPCPPLPGVGGRPAPSPQDCSIRRAPCALGVHAIVLYTQGPKKADCVLDSPTTLSGLEKLSISLLSCCDQKVQLLFTTCICQVEAYVYLWAPNIAYLFSLFQVRKTKYSV